MYKAEIINFFSFEKTINLVSFAELVYLTNLTHQLLFVSYYTINSVLLQIINKVFSFISVRGIKLAYVANHFIVQIS